METEIDISVSDSGYAFLSEVQFKALYAIGEDHFLQLVRSKDVKKVLVALTNGTNPNLADPKTGDSALHIAVEQKSRVLVRMLIVFDADLKQKNHQGQTALDVAKIKGYVEIAGDISKVLTLREELDRDASKERYRFGRGDDETFLLSLDGGGIRGLVFVQVLLEMEKRRKHRYPHSNPLLSEFNWVTGNSTGGIAALAFTASNMGLWQGRKMYFQLKDEVLGGDPPFPNKKVDKVFQKVFGQHKKMSDIKGQKVSIMTTLAKTSPALLHIMSNYGGPRNGEQPPSEQLIWKAARATSSVPLFFHPQDDIYLDGGLIANNPTTDAIVDMFDHDKDVKLKLVLSLGCGLEKPKGIDDIDFKANPKVLDFFLDLLKNNGLQEAVVVLRNINATKGVMEIATVQITQPNGQVLARSKFIAEKVGADYFRINPDIGDVSFLTTDDEVLINMLHEVTCYMLENCHTITDPVLDCVYGV